MRAQMRVEPVADDIATKIFRQIKMRHLPQRMYAGVGAARAVHPHLFAAQGTRRSLQCALHRRGIVLNLPAAKRPAVILDGKLVARHQLNRTGGCNGVPRKYASAFIGCLPARCNSRTRIAPSPQAIVNRSSSNVPGAPDPPANSQRRILTRTASPSTG